MLIVILVLGVSFNVEASSIPKYINGNVYDELDVISKDTVDIVDSVNLNMSNNKEFKGAQIMIATIKDLGGRPAFDYSVDFFNEVTIGSSKENNGILILLAKDSSKEGYNVEIRVGYGLEGALNDGKVGRIIDKAIRPSVKSDNIDEGIRQGFLDISNEIDKEYGSKIISNELQKNYTPTSDLDVGMSINVGKAIVILLIIVVAVIAMLAMVTKNPLFIDLLYVIIQLLLSIGGGSSNNSGSNRSGGGGRTGGGGAGRSM